MTKRSVRVYALRCSNPIASKVRRTSASSSPVYLPIFVKLICYSQSVCNFMALSFVYYFANAESDAFDVQSLRGRLRTEIVLSLSTSNITSYVSFAYSLMVAVDFCKTCNLLFIHRIITYCQ